MGFQSREGVAYKEPAGNGLASLVEATEFSAGCEPYVTLVVTESCDELVFPLCHSRLPGELQSDPGYMLLKVRAVDRRTLHTFVFRDRSARLIDHYLFRAVFPCTQKAGAVLALLVVRVVSVMGLDITVAQVDITGEG